MYQVDKGLVNCAGYFLSQARVSWEQELPPSHWSVGKSVVCFLEQRLIGKGLAHCGPGLPWAVGSGLLNKSGASNVEQASR